MSLFYSGTTGGFYDDTIHGARTIAATDEDGHETIIENPDSKIPADAVGIDQEAYDALMQAQSAGMVIVADRAGFPEAKPKPGPTISELETDALLQRSMLLKDSDWVVLRSVETGTPVPSAWSSYRQALRDITTQSGFPQTITWPVKPSA